MEELDTLVADYIEQTSAGAATAEKILSAVLDLREETRRAPEGDYAEVRKRAAEAEALLKRLYDSIESGVTDLSDPVLKGRIAELKATRDQARLDAQACRGGAQSLWAGNHAAGSEGRLPGPRAWVWGDRSLRNHLRQQRTSALVVDSVTMERDPWLVHWLESAKAGESAGQTEAQDQPETMSMAA